MSRRNVLLGWRVPASEAAVQASPTGHAGSAVHALQQETAPSLETRTFSGESPQLESLVLPAARQCADLRQMVCLVQLECVVQPPPLPLEGGKPAVEQRGCHEC